MVLPGGAVVNVMAMRKAVTTTAEKVQFGERICFRPDDDNRAVLNACDIRWATQSHAINAILRRGLQQVIPEGLKLSEHPFDSDALDGPPPIARKLEKAMRPAKRGK